MFLAFTSAAFCLCIYWSYSNMTSCCELYLVLVCCLSHGRLAKCGRKWERKVWGKREWKMMRVSKARFVPKQEHVPSPSRPTPPRSGDRVRVKGGRLVAWRCLWGANRCEDQVLNTKVVARCNSGRNMVTMSKAHCRTRTMRVNNVMRYDVTMRRIVETCNTEQD